MLLLPPAPIGCVPRKPALPAAPLPNSQLSDNMQKPGFVDHHDHFKNSTPASEWRSCLEHAEKIGLGSRKYTLIRI